MGDQEKLIDPSVRPCVCPFVHSFINSFILGSQLCEREGDCHCCLRLIHKVYGAF